MLSRLVTWDAPGGDRGRPWTDPEIHKVRLGQTLLPLPHNLQLGVGSGLTNKARKPQVPRNKVSSQRNPRPEGRGLGLVWSYTAEGIGPLENSWKSTNKKQTALQVMQMPADKSACCSSVASHR